MAAKEDLQLPAEQVRDFQENGVTVLRGFLQGPWFARCQELYDWTHANPVRSSNLYNSENYTNDITIQYVTDEKTGGRDQGQEMRQWEAVRPLAFEGPFADAAQQLWGGSKQTRVFFYDREIFTLRSDQKSPKTGEVGRNRTPFHQDTSLFPFNGAHLVNFWIPLHDVPKEHCLQVVKGSHKWRMYDHAVFSGPDDTRGMFRDKGTWALPKLPDILALKAQGQVETLSWDLKAGDCLAIHSHSMHGGGGTSEEKMPEAKRLVLRYFGDACYLRPLPVSPEEAAKLPMPWLKTLQVGDPFWQAKREPGSTELQFPLVRGGLTPLTGPAAFEVEIGNETFPTAKL